MFLAIVQTLIAQRFLSFPKLKWTQTFYKIRRIVEIEKAISEKKVPNKKTHRFSGVSLYDFFWDMVWNVECNLIRLILLKESLENIERSENCSDEEKKFLNSPFLQRIIPRKVIFQEHDVWWSLPSNISITHLFPIWEFQLILRPFAKPNKDQDWKSN
jgi:hypothetical protein